MRVALVSPYSWTYGGGVNGHVADLAEELGRRHDVRILAPWDPPDRITRLTHRGSPQEHAMPENLVPLGRSFALSGNGSVSNLAWSPTGMVKLRRALAAEPFDVVHVHEPIAPFIGPDTCSWRGAPVVGTFHAYSTNSITNNLGNLAGVRRKLNQLHQRIAVSEAAAWTGRRWFGGEYTVIPNGVDLSAPPSRPKPASAELRVLFVGRPEERKGLPVLLRAFEALVEHVPARLTVIGADDEELARYLPDPETARWIDALGRVPDEELWGRLHGADVLCAPSLAGESFGMILTEAFAAATPVVASRIAGYSDVVTDGADGVLVPPADAQALAEELQRLHHEPERRERMGAEARRSAERYAWPRIASEVETVYERALEAPEPAGARDRVARRVGLRPAGGGPNIRPQRLPSLDPAPAGAGRHRKLRRIGLGVAGIAGVGLTAMAAQKIGVDSVLSSVVRSDLSWVLFAVALMCSSMFLRAGSWFSIARSALPNLPLRRRDVTSATMIGVLMSATLPARLGEPARAMVLARHSGGRMRETFPVLLGTLISQSALNIVALVLLGVIIVGSTDLFHTNTEKLFLASTAPLILLVAVVLAPTFVRRNGSGRVARIAASIRGALVQVRSGLHVFRDPRRAPGAVVLQLGAWAIQLFACFALLEAMGLESAGIGAAAAVLFAVNVTAVVPATPSNVGVFQLAVISVLTTGFDVSAADALAYGVILQAVEVATAVTLGLPALVREGMTWSDMRVRALSAAPVRLAPRGGAAVDS
ncbi:MAG TPA: lysylphosphatidylglycerol synthase domain-containing protein [Solirubrobacterales bacterium]